jgi:hypothetical protein
LADVFVSSLRNRIRAMNTLYARCVEDMTLDQVNHHERVGVLPIAFSLSHYIRAQDQSVSGPLLRERTLWDSGAGAAKVGVTVDRLGRDETVEEMEQVLPELPPNMQQIFCAMVIGPGAPLRKLDVLECFVYQHGLRHMGEIEHGRALVGLKGMTS